jgi:hypothetical protein
VLVSTPELENRLVQHEGSVVIDGEQAWNW